MLCDKKNELLWEANKHCSKKKKTKRKKKKIQKNFFEKDSKNSNLDFTSNVVKLQPTPPHQPAHFSKPSDNSAGWNSSRKTQVGGGGEVGCSNVVKRLKTF